MTTNDKKEEIEVSAQEELNYKKSGVDVEAGYELVQKIKPFAPTGFICLSSRLIPNQPLEEGREGRVILCATR